MLIRKFFSIAEAYLSNTVPDNTRKVLMKSRTTQFTVNIFNPAGITPFVDAGGANLAIYALVLNFT